MLNNILNGNYRIKKIARRLGHSYAGLYIGGNLGQLHRVHYKLLERIRNTPPNLTDKRYRVNHKVDIQWSRLQQSMS
jgi:hypothetical protein